jgi:hypothetical protein
VGADGKMNNTAAATVCRVLPVPTKISWARLSRLFGLSFASLNGFRAVHDSLVHDTSDLGPRSVKVGGCLLTAAKASLLLSLDGARPATEVLPIAKSEGKL